MEVDGYAFHSSPSAFERDRVKQLELQARGFTVMRFSARRVRDEPEATLAALARALSP